MVALRDGSVPEVAEISSANCAAGAKYSLEIFAGLSKQACDVHVPYQSSVREYRQLGVYESAYQSRKEQSLSDFAFHIVVRRATNAGYEISKVLYSDLRLFGKPKNVCELLGHLDFGLQGESLCSSYRVQSHLRLIGFTSGTRETKEAREFSVDERLGEW